MQLKFPSNSHQNVLGLHSPEIKPSYHTVKLTLEITIVSTINT
jgi:hypothetical protein